MTVGHPRPIVRAAVVSIGTEITVGEIRDTNAGTIARALADNGVAVSSLTALPDDLAAVSDTFRRLRESVDLVVSTGGLGPTPDDLTREAIAAALGETPTVDPALETWLRGLWQRRRLPFAEINLKQAWLIPSATPIENTHGTAPGWWVDRPDGALVVAMPGPPREMTAMWADTVLPRLRARGLGVDMATRTLRLSGIGESGVAEMLGEALLRSANPIVATYARADAVDVRITATGSPEQPASELVGDAEVVVRRILGSFVWASGTTTWAEAIGASLAGLGATLATAEDGTGGALAALIGTVPGLVRSIVSGDAATGSPRTASPRDLATQLRNETGATIALAVRAAPRGQDTAVSIAVASPLGVRSVRRVVFLTGQTGRERAALAAAAVLLDALRALSVGPSGTVRQGRG